VKLRPGADDSDLREVLDAHGEVGWELVGPIALRSTCLIFKRAVNANPAR
jgi:hypothetical protein